MKLKRIHFYKATALLGNLNNLQDMLRYDLAFQWRKDPSIIAFPTFKGDLGGRPTLGRWESFSISLRPLPNNLGSGFVPVGKELVHLVPEEWITYVHPRTTFGPTDYSQYKAVTLAHALAVKEWRDVAVVPDKPLLGGFYAIHG